MSLGVCVCAHDVCQEERGKGAGLIKYLSMYITTHQMYTKQTHIQTTHTNTQTHAIIIRTIIIFLSWISFSTTMMLARLEAATV